MQPVIQLDAPSHGLQLLRLAGEIQTSNGGADNGVTPKQNKAEFALEAAGFPQSTSLDLSCYSLDVSADGAHISAIPFHVGVLQGAVL